MGNLRQQHCEPCRSGATPATETEMAAMLRELTGWELQVIDGVVRLHKSYRFKNFAEALDFSCRVGALAELEGHHPALLTEWGKVTVQWWTHKISGLHRNDFVMAARTDALQEKPA